MNKEDLIQHLFLNQSDKKKVSKIKISELVDKLFEKMSDELNNGKEIQISDFGNFSLTTKSLRPIVKYSMKKKR